MVFGARNLGRAVIELLASDGWAVTGAARSQSTLDGVGAAGALALEADVTDPANVHGVLEQAAAAHGGVDLLVNAAAAYGGERSGPFAFSVGTTLWGDLPRFFRHGPCSTQQRCSRGWLGAKPQESPMIRTIAAALAAFALVSFSARADDAAKTDTSTTTKTCKATS